MTTNLRDTKKEYCILIWDGREYIIRSQSIGFKGFGSVLFTVNVDAQHGEKDQY